MSDTLTTETPDTQRGEDVSQAGEDLTTPHAQSRFARLLRYVGTPLFLGATVAALWGWIASKELIARERNILNMDRVIEELGAHIQLTVVATVIVLAIAIPLGIVLTRPFARRAKPFALGLANAGQAIPSFGVVVLVAVWTGAVGFRPSIFALVIYAILPVLRNTMVGIEQVDAAVIDAARGMGMSKRQVLTRIELPLAVPVIVAGVRTALVIVVGTAALATFIDGGGFGDFINNGIKLNSRPVLITGSVLTAVLALTIDWIGGIAEDVLRPRGL